MTEITFTKFERDSALFKKIRDHLAERLEYLREKNDSELLDAEQTASMRGQIKEIKRRLKDMSEPAQVTAPKQTPPYI
jgi:uncharacterized protein (DUF2164 family)